MTEKSQFPGFGLPNIPRIPDVGELTRIISDNPKVLPAKYIFQKIVQLIADFETRLDDASEIGFSVVSLPTGDTMHVRDVGYLNPDLLIFNGISSDGRPIQLVQHHSQLSVMLTAAPKIEDKPMRIGFILLEKVRADP